MFSRLLVPTDLTTATDIIVKNLSALQKLGAQHCLLLHCLSLNELNAMDLEHVRQDSDQNLQRLREILEPQGFSVETRRIEDQPRQAINQIAAKENYGMIVVGAFAHTLAGEVFMGGLAYDIIHFALQPVLLFRLQENPGDDLPGITIASPVLGRHVLFPTDFSANAGHAFKVIKELVMGGVNRVTLLHVQDQFTLEPYLLDRLEEFNQADNLRLQSLQQELQALGEVEVDIQLLFGFPSLEIIRFVQEQAVSLVVMGSQGRSFIQELFLGSVSHNVARKANCSVLLIPAAGR